MRKIFVINNGTSGLYGFRREVIEALLEKYDVTAAATFNGHALDLKALGVNVINTEFENHGTNPISELKLVSEYKKLMREIGPDVILTYTIKPNIYGGMAAASLGIPYIANITGLGTAVENGGLMQKITVPLYRRGLRKAQKVFFQNAENRDFMLKKHVVKGDYDLLPGSGVNLERFALLDYPEGETVKFVMMSRLMKEKGIGQFLDAAEHLKKQKANAEFHVFGECTSEFKERVDKLNENGTIVYHGYTRDAVSVYRLSCCTVHPTYYPEGMSNVLLESCASGRPIITTDRAGCREIVEDGVNGFVVKQRSSEDLIAKMEKFLALSWNERKEMGLAGRNKVEREFDRRIVVDKYLREIERAVK